MTHGIYTDFFNKSLPMPTEGPSDADEAAALLGGLTSAEIRRVIFAPRYCPRLESGFDSVGYFVRMRNRVFRSVKSSVPRGIAATLAAEVVMYPGCFNDPEITRLAFGIARCMICSLPFPIYNDEIFKDINKLVYRIGIIPIFAEFNRYLLFYPEDIIRKLLNVPGAAFQFNVRSLDYKDTVKFVMSLISSGKHVLFGTGARRAGRYEADTGDHFRLLRRSLGEADFNLLMLGALKFCRPPVYSR